MYDIFVIGNNINWKNIKSKYPFAKKVSNFNEAKSKALTPMFWAVWDDIEVKDDFDFTLSVPKWDEDYVHVWKNKEYFDGLSLVPRSKHISDREIKYRFFTDKKEVDQVASKPKKYDIFEIETYEQYLEAMEKSTTDMFWMTSPNLKIADDFKFDLYITHHNAYERQENHAFVHLVNGEKLYNGVFLLSKHKPVSKKEIEHRYIIERKEWDIVASGPCQYDKFVVDTYEQYLEAKEKSKTEMFWIISSNLTVLDDFKFDLYFEHNNVYDRSITHVFRNGEYFDGVMLTPKSIEISKREFDAGFLVNRKDYDILASIPKKFEKFNITTYQDYLDACEKSTTSMFWAIWYDVNVVEDFEFDYYVPKYNQHLVYVFKNDKYFDGICLFSKYTKVSEREFKYRFFTDKKEIDYIISYPKKYDIFEIETYEQYLEAIDKSTTDMFWMTSPNLKIADDFKFDLYFEHYNSYDRNITHVFRNSEFYDGIMLVPRSVKISKEEFDSGLVANRKEWDVLATTPKKFEKFNIATYQDYLDAREKSSTSMFWAIWPDVEVVEDFEFDYYVPKYNQHLTYIFKNGQHYDGVCLFGKHSQVSEKEFNYRFFAEKKEIDYIISYPKKYDIFEIETYEQYLEAMEKSTTDMFWMTSPNLTVADDFNFDLYITHHNAYERQENHAFIHLVNGEKYYSGIFLLSKNKPITKKEVEHRYIVERKEWDIVASVPCQYEKFIVDTYEDYLHAMKTSRTEMFYMIPSDVDIMPDFKFDMYYTHDKEFERKTHHALINGGFYDGIFLVSKYKEISKKEIDGKFIIDRKEEEILASRPVKFDKFDITTYQDYLEACERSTTNMFWCIWSDVNVVEDFEFDYYVPRYNQHITHVFKNDKYFDGICLFSKHSKVNEKEFKYRFFSEKKEIDYILSYPKKYDIFKVNTYKDYLTAMENSKTEMFWMVPNEVEVLPDFKFDLYFSYHNTYERRTNHSFKHLFRGEETYNGVCLMSKHVPVSEKEITFRYLVERKEWDTIASKMKPYDVVFISYNESNADENFERVKSLFPAVKRVHGVKGIHQAHIKAAEQAETENFWVVDGDAVIVDDFKFDYEIPVWERDTVHVWRSQNPINNLVYGYGGVKLLPRQLTLDMDVTRPDMTTSISNKFKPVQVISNITAFNTDEFSTWKSAFRECAKLAGKAIDRQVDAETEERLNVWCTQGADKPYGEYAIKGALAGRKFATEHPEDLFKINDFDWLYQQYEEDISK